METNDYMSLTKIAEGYSFDPSWARGKWLSEPTSLELIQLWESMHNLDFNNEAYNDLCANALSIGCAPKIHELIDIANIKSFIFKNDFIYLHKDIALDFASWLSPSFRAYCSLCLQNGECLNFVSEEDFIISDKSLARYTQKYALDSYEYYIKAKLCTQKNS